MKKKSHEDVKKAFHILDKDRSGFIEEDELKYANTAIISLRHLCAAFLCKPSGLHRKYNLKYKLKYILFTIDNPVEIWAVEMCNAV